MAPSLAKRPPRPDLSPPRTLVTHGGGYPLTSGRRCGMLVGVERVLVVDFLGKKVDKQGTPV